MVWFGPDGNYMNNSNAEFCCFVMVFHLTKEIITGRERERENREGKEMRGLKSQQVEVTFRKLEKPLNKLAFVFRNGLSN